MHSFFAEFPELLDAEFRTITRFEPGTTEIPDFENAPKIYLEEYYCIDPDCDCQRVLLEIAEIKDPRHPQREDVAAISFAWGDSPMNLLVGELGNPFLEPMCFQGDDAEEILELVNTTCLSDPRYVDRLERHYHQLRERFHGTGMTSEAHVLGSEIVARQSPFRLDSQVRLSDNGHTAIADSFPHSF